LLSGLSPRVVHFGGTIRRSDQMSFKKLLFRLTRGNALVNFFELKISDIDKEHLGSFDHLAYIVVFEEG